MEEERVMLSREKLDYLKYKKANFPNQFAMPMPILYCYLEIILSIVNFIPIEFSFIH